MMSVKNNIDAYICLFLVGVGILVIKCELFGSGHVDANAALAGALFGGAALLFGW